MREYHITLTGTSPILMHNRNLEWEVNVKRWEKDAANKSKSVKGDDRSPGWSWLGKLHHNEEVVCLPVDMLASCMMYGGAMVPLPTGKSNTTCKSLSQSGCIIEGFFWPLVLMQPTNDPKKPKRTTIPVAPLFALKEEEDFTQHETLVKSLDFRLHIKPAKVGQSSHIRVRPCFEGWQVEGHITVTDDQLTQSLLATILEYAGKYKGVGDWRPGCKTPGPWGMFTAAVAAV